MNEVIETIIGALIISAAIAFISEDIQAIK
jgi:hypothetical protein